MNRCGDCKHWGKPTETHEQFRQCQSVVHDKTRMVASGHWKEDQEEEEDYAELIAFRADHKAVVHDGSGYIGRLCTREDFGCVLFEERPEPTTPLSEAASSLYEHLGMPRYPHWVQSIGIGKDRLFVMLVREPMRHEGSVPTEWQGFPVESKVVGEIRIGPEHV